MNLDHKFFLSEQIKSGDLRSDAHQSQIIGGDTVEDRTQIIGGDTVKLLGGYIPPGFRHACLCEFLNFLAPLFQNPAYAAAQAHGPHDRPPEAHGPPGGPPKSPWAPGSLFPLPPLSEALNQCLHCLRNDFANS